MKLFLDTEFNGFNGELLSIALVPSNKSEPNFYCELDRSNIELDPWVAENVAFADSPDELLSREQVQTYLHQYLNRFVNIEIIADWPDDIRYFCELLITGPGYSIDVPKKKITFTLDMNIEYESVVPHHALHDAIGIRNYWKEQ